MGATLLSAILLAALAPPSGAFAPPRAPRAPPRPPAALASYLDSLAAAPAAAPPAAGPPRRAPLASFAPDRLAPKGPRAGDRGAPREWSRPFAGDGALSAGCWRCTEGGWPSPNGKAATEVFYMLDGHGALGDADGAEHRFGPGDLVIIPKGHTGRWDVHGTIHKLWAVNAHDRVEEAGPIVRVRVEHYKDFGHLLEDTSAHDPLYGSTGGVPSASQTFYYAGPTQVGVWTCDPGTFEVAHGARQWFHMLEGTMFITDGAEGTSQRCVPGDTVLLPAGWTGHVDVVAPVKKLFTVAQ